MKTHLDDSGRVLFAWLTVLFLSLFLASASPCRAEEGAVLFEDDFESGTLASDKWTSAVGPYGESKIEIVEMPGRGKVLHVVGDTWASWVSPNLTLGDIPYVLDYDAYIPEYKGEDKTAVRSSRVSLWHRPWERDTTNGWGIMQEWYCYTFVWPNLAKTHYQPAWGGPWTHYRVDSDGGILSYGALTPDGKESLLPYPIPDWADHPGRIFFQANPFVAAADWKPPAEPPAPQWRWIWDSWLDNVKIVAKPIAERSAYKRHLSNYERLSAIFSDPDYRKAAGAVQAPEMTELARALEEVKSLPPVAAEAYKEKMKAIADLEKACLNFYRRQEAKVFHLTFEKSAVFTPMDFSAFSNHAPERPEVLKGVKIVTEVEAIPFRVSPVGPYVLHLPTEELSTTQIPVGREAKEIFLLMRLTWQTDFLGVGVYAETEKMVEQRSYGVQVLTSREEFPVALQVEVHYADGFSEKVVPERKDGVHFPGRNAPLVWGVRPSHSVAISSLTLHKKTNDLGCEVFGVTLVNGLPEPLVAQVKKSEAREPRKITPGEPTVTIGVTGIILESPSYRMFVPSSGPLILRQFVNKFSGENYLAEGSGPMLLTGPMVKAADYKALALDASGALVPAADAKGTTQFQTWRVVKAEKLPSGEASLDLESDDKAFTGKLLLVANPESVSMRLTLTSRDNERKDLIVLFPVMKNLSLDGYFYPDHMGITSNQPIDFNRVFDGLYGATMQMMAAWDVEGRSGLSLRVEDVPLKFMKAFRLYRPMEDGGKPPRFWSLASVSSKYGAEEIGPMGKGLAFAVQYFDIPLEPGKSQDLPSTVLSVHPGTWKEPLRAYGEWLRTWWKPIREAPERLKYTALCTTGGELLYQTGLAWGGFDFQHLVYSNSADYPEEVQKLIPPALEWAKHLRGREYPMGLGVYAAEGTFIQVRTKLYPDYGERGALRDEEGNVFWYQPYDKQQLWMCAGMPEWRKYLADTEALWAKEVDPVEVYVDTIGVRVPDMCFAKEHAHAAADEEARGKPKLLETVTRAVMEANPKVGVMSEGPGSDYSTQFFDGSWVTFIGPDVRAHPGHFTFFRFLVPTFKFIHLDGDSVTSSKISYFNGFPVNLYLYGGHNRVKEVIRPLVLAYRDNVDVFTSNDVEMDIETGAEGVYMNRFGSAERKKIIYAVANWGNRTWKGALPLETFADAHYVDLTRLRELEAKPAGKGAEVELVIDPFEVVYVGVFKKAIKVGLGGYLDVEYLTSLPKDPSLGLQIESDSLWVWKTGLPAEKRLNLHEVLGRFTATVGNEAGALVKLYSGRDLVDASGVTLTSER